MPLSLKRFAYASGFMAVYALVLNCIFPLTHEFIFPEIAAIVLGMVLLDRLPWEVSETGLFFEVVVGAIAGLVLCYMRFLPFPVLVCAALLFCFFVMFYSRQFMFPMISAVLLPLFVAGGVSPFYVVAVILLTGGALFLRHFTKSKGLQEQEPPFTPSLRDTRREALLWSTAGVLMIVPILFGSLAGPIFVAAPPLLVSFAESIRNAKAPRSAPLLNALLCTICAVIGTCLSLLYGTMDIATPLPRSLCFMAAPILSYALMLILRKPFPPAAALSLLPFLLGGHWLYSYPFMIAGGALYFALAAMLFHAVRRKKSAKAQQPAPAAPPVSDAEQDIPSLHASAEEAEDLSDFYYTSPETAGEEPSAPQDTPASSDAFYKVNPEAFLPSEEREEQP